MKLAVVIIAYLCIIIATGTITESRFDAIAARKLVYDTIWMYLGLGALSVSLIAVMVDRWPWKIRHLPFLCAHIGILVLLFGSVLTMQRGLDGSVSVNIGGRSRSVVVPDRTDILVYASFDGQAMSKMLEKEVDFFLHPPTPEKPLVVPTEKEPIEFIGYKKYVLPSRKVTASDRPEVGAGLRFQIQNDRVNVVEWIVQRRQQALASHDFGPAQIHLGPIPSEGRMANEIFLQPDGAGLKWALFRKDNAQAALQGRVEEGGLIETGWMGLRLRVLRYLPQAIEEWELQDREAPTPLTTSAVKVRFRGKEHWLLLDDTIRLFTEQTGYVVSYLHRRIELGFPIHLENFEMIPYAGTNRAKEYKSRVDLDNGAMKTEISMNEPAKFRGLTIYQASFENDPQGRPVASVFSVNHDPGRVWKYLGSLILSAGIVLLFWFRRSFQPKKGSPS